MLDLMYDESENVKVDFFGYASQETRYDFAIVFTNRFFGKPLVVCMQTGRSSLLSAEDLDNVEYLQQKFSLEGAAAAGELAVLLKQRVPNLELNEQY